MGVWVFGTGAIAAMAAVYWIFGEVLVAAASVLIAYGRFWLFVALKKLGWASVWKFLQPLFVRLAAYELPKRFTFWFLTLAVGARNRRAIQAWIDARKERGHGWARGHYRRLEARLGRWTKPVVGGALVLLSILLSVFVLGVYVIWYSASFVRALLFLGRFALVYAGRWIKIAAFNAVVLSPFQWLRHVLPAGQADTLRRFNFRIMREIVRRRRALGLAGSGPLSAREVAMTFWLPIVRGVQALTGRRQPGRGQSGIERGN